jgi:hypothetical protein
MTALAFIDTETTGLHPERLPWEIAVILRESDGDERELLLQIEDVDLSRADPRGLAVSRFFERHFDYNAESTMPCDVVPERRAAQLVEQYLRGAHIVGCVPQLRHRHARRDAAQTPPAARLALSPDRRRNHRCRLARRHVANARDALEI